VATSCAELMAGMLRPISPRRKSVFRSPSQRLPRGVRKPRRCLDCATDWVKLRVVVEASKVQIYVGPVKEVTLGVRKLGQLDGGQVGLWVGNGSGGDFANLVVTPTK